MLRAVFDMDWVIIDSEPVWQQVRVALADEFGCVWTETDGEEVRGRSSESWSSRISERLGGALTPDEVFDQVLMPTFLLRARTGVRPWWPDPGSIYVP